MAAYPTLPWLRDGTSVDCDGGTDAVRATNGALKVRVAYSAVKTGFTIAHWLTNAQKSTLDTFYGANKLLDVTLTVPTDGASYTARFAAAPTYEQIAPGRWIGRVRMQEA